MSANRTFLRHPELPWLGVTVIVLTLPLTDRFLISDQAGILDQALDWITILCGMLGACLSWWVSSRVPLLARTSTGPALKIRIFFCWVLGPLLIVGVACLARDIDGGLLLFYLPFIGLLLALFVLPCLLVARSRRRSTLDDNESARPD